MHLTLSNVVTVVDQQTCENRDLVSLLTLPSLHRLRTSSAKQVPKAERPGWTSLAVRRPVVKSHSQPSFMHQVSLDCWKSWNSLGQIWDAHCLKVSAQLVLLLLCAIYYLVLLLLHAIYYLVLLLLRAIYYLVLLLLRTIYYLVLLLLHAICYLVLLLLCAIYYLVLLLLCSICYLVLLLLCAVIWFCYFCALSVIWFCYFCALPVIWFCYFCVLPVIWFCYFCALSIIWFCYFCALSVIWVCYFCALSIIPAHYLLECWSMFQLSTKTSQHTNLKLMDLYWRSLSTKWCSSTSWINKMKQKRRKKRS